MQSAKQDPNKKGPIARRATGPSIFLEHETGLASACRFAAGALR
jgi:hypothetical protein